MTTAFTPLLSLADASFVALTTFRRTGEGVSTPVWVARDGDALVVITPLGTGKLKRLKNDPRVTVQPCGRRGSVADDAPLVEARATVSAEADDVTRATDAVRRKYGAEFYIVMFIERLVRRGVGANKPRAVIRIEG
ncbi:PPOX class F420-dependent oxidoreductase [Schumannella sp. 10F1B-5-1]|uniref:PPOX class F420-dependent oxidoreductase n=1 Tax=Schumannella sp. 10F1B-5-1 TaxID=2590780 RepID=UPI0011324552|nr:PPOX class F420-dependent oxidoreductase [Schumannella sp. 10F1B-5-1]TPW76878.1 PPOX class F420-dependent oxidoreductase [Schumannella sp. 10F1B-5-1]